MGEDEKGNLNMNNKDEKMNDERKKAYLPPIMTVVDYEYQGILCGSEVVPDDDDEGYGGGFL